MADLGPALGQQPDLGLHLGMLLVAPALLDQLQAVAGTHPGLQLRRRFHRQRGAAQGLGLPGLQLAGHPQGQGIEQHRDHQHGQQGQGIPQLLFERAAQDQQDVAPHAPSWPRLFST